MISAISEVSTLRDKMRLESIEEAGDICSHREIHVHFLLAAKTVNHAGKRSAIPPGGSCTTKKTARPATVLKTSLVRSFHMMGKRARNSRPARQKSHWRALERFSAAKTDKNAEDAREIVHRTLREMLNHS